MTTRTLAPKEPSSALMARLRTAEPIFGNLNLLSRLVKMYKLQNALILMDAIKEIYAAILKTKEPDTPFNKIEHFPQYRLMPDSVGYVLVIPTCYELGALVRIHVEDDVPMIGIVK